MAANRLPPTELPAGTTIAFRPRTPLPTLGIRTGTVTRYTTPLEFMAERAGTCLEIDPGNREALMRHADERWPVVRIICRDFPAGVEVIVYPGTFDPLPAATIGRN